MKLRGLLGLGENQHTIATAKSPQATITVVIYFMFLADTLKPMKQVMNIL